MVAQLWRRESLPSRERELKQAQRTALPSSSVSLPSRERELKLQQSILEYITNLSLPSRERELKRCVVALLLA